MLRTRKHSGQGPGLSSRHERDASRPVPLAGHQLLDEADALAPSLPASHALCLAPCPLAARLHHPTHPPTLPSPPPPTCGQCAQHAQRRSGDAVHACQAVAGVDGNGDGNGGDDAGLVAQRQAKDDVGGSTSAAGVGHILRSMRGGERGMRCVIHHNEDEGGAREKKGGEGVGGDGRERDRVQITTMDSMDTGA